MNDFCAEHIMAQSRFLYGSGITTYWPWIIDMKMVFAKGKIHFLLYLMFTYHLNCWLKQRQIIVWRYFQMQYTAYWEQIVRTTVHLLA